jgi:hypothetical protein
VHLHCTCRSQVDDLHQLSPRQAEGLQQK